MTDQQKVREAFPRYAAYRHLRAYGAWPSGVPDWAKNHEGSMDDVTLRNAVIDELAQAALSHASSATVEENLTVGVGKAVAWRSKNYDPIFNGGYAWAFTCDPGSVTPVHEPLYTHPAPSAEDVRDAARYRWLRGTDLNREFEVCREAKDGSMYVLEGSLLDEAIDQALAAERGEE